MSEPPLKKQNKKNNKIKKNTHILKQRPTQLIKNKTKQTRLRHVSPGWHPQDESHMAPSPPRTLVHTPLCDERMGGPKIKLRT